MSSWPLKVRPDSKLKFLHRSSSAEVLWNSKGRCFTCMIDIHIIMISFFHLKIQNNWASWWSRSLWWLWSDVMITIRCDLETRRSGVGGIRTRCPLEYLTLPLLCFTRHQIIVIVTIITLFRYYYIYYIYIILYKYIIFIRKGTMSFRGWSYNI